MVIMGISNNLSKFESQILSYKKVTEFEILSYVNKARVFLLLHMFIHEYWYEFKSNVAFWLITSFMNTINQFILSVTFIFPKKW